jgi:hypothetical protein
MCDVTFIGVYDTYLHSKCFLPAMYNNMICLVPSQSTLLFVSSDSRSNAHASSRSSSLRTDRHTSCRNTVCSVFACAAKTRCCRCFSLEGQCCECFTSIRLCWDAFVLGLPLEEGNEEKRLAMSLTFRKSNSN